MTVNDSQILLISQMLKEGHSHAEIAAAVNRQFDTSYDRLKMKSRISNLRTRYGREIIPLSPSRAVPDGSFRIANDATGIYRVLIKSHGKWVSYAKTIWEAANGPLPDDHLLMFRNHNAEDVRIENLEAVPKYLARKLWHADTKQPAELFDLTCLKVENDLMMNEIRKNTLHAENEYQKTHPDYQPSYIREKNRKIRKQQRSRVIGERHQMGCGQYAVITDYQDSNHVTVRFDDGTVVTTRYGQFRKGKVRNPSVPKSEYSGKRAAEKAGKKAIGQSLIMHCGHTATITAYRSFHDIDVAFEDGTPVLHADMARFRDQSILYPGELANKKYYKKRKDDSRKKYLGTSRRMKCGMNAEITDYQDANHITVRFEDGTIVKNCQLSHFTSGSIGNPNITKSSYTEAAKKQTFAERYVGKSAMMHCGQMLTITAWRSYYDVDAVFEDGTPVHTKMQSFNNHCVTHPGIKPASYRKSKTK